MPADCDNWFDASQQGVLAGTGDANKTDSRWSFQGPGIELGWGNIGGSGSFEVSCAAKRRLYCFEQ